MDNGIGSEIALEVDSTIYKRLSLNEEKTIMFPKTANAPPPYSWTAVLYV